MMEVNPWCSHQGGLLATNGDVYFMAVIDILQTYDLKKRMESTIKTIKHGAEKISAVSSIRYGTRFVKFMESLVVTPDD